jgi:hypothetical protein
MSKHTSETCARLGCHDGRFLSRHHVCQCADEAYDRLHGVDGHTQADRGVALPGFATDRLFDQRDDAIERARRYRLAWLSAQRRANRGWLNYHAAIGILDATDREGVGTGAGEDATGQDTGTAWVTRSVDCPEAPAQAHPLAATDLPGVACFDHRWVGVVRDCMRCDVDPPRKASDSSRVALEVLAQLSGRSTDGRLRDAIALVRSALWDEVEP